MTDETPHDSVADSVGTTTLDGVDHKEGQVEIDEAAEEQVKEKVRREREARAQALTLEIVGDLPYAEVKPPENVLFVCKLNPVTEDEDLDTIFSRFGSIISCEVIRDKRTHDSLQYAFIEFENQKDCEQAYFKMQGVLIDDHRIHVDFSQSVSRLSDTWRTSTNTKRRQHGGGFGGVADLEKRRQYRARDSGEENHRRHHEHRMIFTSKDGSSQSHNPQERSRSRSPRCHGEYKERFTPRQHRRRDRSREHQRSESEDHRRRR